jgi:adenylate kinase
MQPTKHPEEILEVITENFIVMLLDKVNQIYRRHSRNTDTNKNKEDEKTQKQINELIGAINLK